MEHPISATELACRLGEVLRRVRCRGDSFLVERDGVPVARIVPAPEVGATSVAGALAGWRAAGAPSASFADDLERVRGLRVETIGLTTP